MNRFDRDLHEYWSGERRFPSVTEILTDFRMVKDLSFLDPFYRQRGLAVHQAIELYFQGEEIDWSFEGGEEHVLPRFRRFERLAERAGLKPILCEVPLFSTLYGYAGTLDYFGPYLGRPFAFLDWKGDSCDPGHDLQVAGGYKGLVLELAHEKAIAATPAEVLAAPCFLVPLGGTSDLPLVRPIHDDDGGFVDMFRGLAAAWNWRVARHGGFR